MTLSNATMTSISARITEFIRENLLYMRPNFDLAEDAPLIETRVIDSMGILELISFLEDSFGIVIGDADVNEANLGTIAAMSAFVARKQTNVAPSEVM
jgi:acyl carrier protein